MQGTKKTHAEYVEQVDALGTGFTVVGNYAGSKTPIAHRCSKGHESYKMPNQILNAKGCKYCYADRQKKSQEKYVKQVEALDSGITVVGTYVKAEISIMHRCSKGHEWKKTPRGILKGIGCFSCATEKRKKTHAQYVKEVEALDKGITVVGTYVGAKTQIIHRCSEGHDFLSTSGNILQGNNCPDCSESNTDADVFYIWQNGDSGIYKVGITSQRCTRNRISVCSNKNKMTANMVLKINTPNARDIERAALEMGTVTDYPSTIDGYTEFRYFTDAQLTDVCQMANQMSQGS